MKIEPLSIEGAFEISAPVHADHRGEFSRFYCESTFSDHGLNTRWVQHNRSLTKVRGAVRGMHFQYPPHAEIKLVQCVSGAVFDVLVDLRAHSRSFGQWLAVTLDSSRHNAVYIPHGVAHGFQAQTDDARLIYLHSSAYAPQAEGGVRHDDPDLDISWPLPVVEVSEKDRALPSLSHIQPVEL